MLLARCWTLLLTETAMPAFDSTLNAALAHALTDPRVAAVLALAALRIAIAAKRTDLSWRANEVLAVVR